MSRIALWSVTIKMYAHQFILTVHLIEFYGYTMTSNSSLSKPLTMTVFAPALPSVNFFVIFNNHKKATSPIYLVRYSIVWKSCSFPL